MSNTQTNLTPSLVLDVDSWIKDAQKKAVEYEGMPEADDFLLVARRFLALKNQIAELQALASCAANR